MPAPHAYRHTGFFFNLIALGLFVPGVLLPIFSLNMDLSAWVAQSNLTSGIVNKELSILGTIEELWQDQRHLVALLIFAFSIVIPLSKAGLVTLAWWQHHKACAVKILDWVGVIGKWSMADVFVVAIFLAVLSTDHAQTKESHTLSMFGFKLNVEVSTQTLSNLGPGFYYFTAYCLLSIFATLLIFKGQKLKQRQLTDH